MIENCILTDLSEAIVYIKSITTCNVNFGNNNNFKLFHVAQPTEFAQNSISWLNVGIVPDNIINDSSHNLFLINNKYASNEIDVKKNAIISVSDPKWVMASIVKKFMVKKKTKGIHHTAIIDEEAEIHSSASIGPYCVVGKCKIDENVILHGHNYIYDNVQIGKGSIVHANSVLGAAGSGFVKNLNGNWEQFPQLGGLVLGENVEVGVNTYINKGAFGNTIIEDNVKIGLSCCIGHNVYIKRNTMVLANSVIAGGVQIGENSWISIGALIKNKVVVGNNATVGMGAVVVKNVEDNITVIGNPARNILNK